MSETIRYNSGTPFNSVRNTNILSMTKYERSKPKIINGSRKKRIATGSGTKVSDINRVLKQHKKMTDMMKKFSKNGMNSMSPDQLSGQFGNMIPSDIFKK